MTRRKPIIDIAKSERAKKLYATNPEYYAKICRINKENGNKPEEKKLRSERMKEVWARPGYKENTMHGGKHGNRSEETKQHMKDSWTQERRLKQSERAKKNGGLKRSEETKESIRKSREKYWESLSENDRKELIEKMKNGHGNGTGKRKRHKPRSEEQKKKLRDLYWQSDRFEKDHQRMLGKNNPNWRGGIGCTVQYCEKFNKEFKKRCRAYFDYTCVECGTPENGHGHFVHHINYDKQICCNETKPLFVILCASCHGKTNYNRDMWQQYFTEMTEGYYESKCFFSKEEYNQITCGSSQMDHQSGD